MRKLNELLRSLARFLHDPADHVTQAWKLVRAQVSTPADPKLRDALVVIDNVVGAVSYFLTDKTEEAKAGGEPVDSEPGERAHPVADAPPAP